MVGLKLLARHQLEKFQLSPICRLNDDVSLSSRGYLVVLVSNVLFSTVCKVSPDEDDVVFPEFASPPSPLAALLVGISMNGVTD